MKVTKLVHSCLIIEHENKKFLVNPGNYSWQSGLVNDDILSDINAVLITHNHPDHMDINFVEDIYKASPSAVYYGPPQVFDQLSK